MRDDAIISRTYKDAGVDIDAGSRLVDALKPLARATRRPGADSDLGGFGAVFDLKPLGYRDPLLVAGTDGVGTKLRIAIEAGRLETVGIDLVAMCVNDLVVQGAEPLFFLDYYATGALSVADATRVIGGIAEGCKTAGAALIGGETAEMPGMYAGADFDLAGFALGIVERERLLTGAAARPGDVVLGLGASGPHSNGYSLIRKIVSESGLGYDAPAPFATDDELDTPSLGEALLVPTRIYVRPCLEALSAGGVHALAHITGGGLVENIPRVLPGEVTAVIDAGRWPLPPVFRWLMETGKVVPREMARTFNCGIGMVVAVAPDRAGTLRDIFETHGLSVHEIGRLEPREAAAIRFENLEAWQRD
ncbi:MAG: phosphoribosylformylglycinamidine cyclo-ligase [Alphaproteobacteria bacterium]